MPINIHSILNRSRTVISAIMMVSLVLAASPATACQENAMLVFDSSGSMSTARDGERKIDTAREAAADILPDVTSRRPTGLITYGGVPGATCSGVALKVPPLLQSGGLILGELGMMEPSGQTPLTDAVSLAAETLQSLHKPGVIVLVTDGLENCGYNACALAQKLKTGTPNIKVHVIGFHLLDPNENKVSCLATLTGGTYTSTNSLESLRKALKTTLGCPRIS